MEKQIQLFDQFEDIVFFNAQIKDNKLVSININIVDIEKYNLKFMEIQEFLKQIYEEASGTN